MSDRDGRPSPEALLAEAQRESRGRLKIFLGAAPGVGKTYEMLSAAQARARDGTDVVIGVVETHGRTETEALVAGLDVIPRRHAEYRGRKLEEMDLDALLARHPQLALVDELAHTNVPGSRHPKRYMDVEELLAAGIDVYATLNIQHVESLNDVVARITRIRVRETVPDSVIDRADDIELIDLTPEDLIQRLKEGKVYVPHQAERAIRHYFAPGNLTALRELALRRTAQRVDEQMVRYMQAHAINGPWAAGERVLVCVSGDPDSVAVVRHARRLADRLKAPWIALHVETSRNLRMTEAERNHVAEALRLAQRLGGEAVTLPGQDVAETVAEYARANNVTQIIAVQAPRARWRDMLFGSVAQRIIRKADGATVYVISQPRQPDEHDAPHTPTPPRPFELQAETWLGSLACVAVAAVVGLLVRQMIGAGSISLLFLTAVLVSAVLFGLWPALLACIVSTLAYNFLFLPPLYTFTIADPENVIALFFFAVAAVIVSNLTARVRAQAITARARARTTEELYLFSRKLAVATNLDDLLWATVHQIALMLKVRVVLLLPEEERIVVRAGFPPEDTLDDADLAAARWCWEKNRPAGRGADTLPGAKRLFLPMQTGRGAVGVIGIDRDEPGPMLTPDQQRLLDALADQAALAIERVNLVEAVDRARLAVETDRLRSALLTSISHDLRTPLASILGSATSLSGALDVATRDAMARNIQDEAERLNRFIGNLLDMTRLESGPLPTRTSLTELSDVVGSALQRASKVLVNHAVQMRLESGLPLLELDDVLLEQALFNLLDNAAKYTQPGSRITISAWREGGQVKLQVIDEGQGIPPADLERIFDKFYRAGGPDHRRAGTGLGLSICRGFIEAMGGTIVASNRTDRPGAVFTIALPVPASADRPLEAAG
ncbi:MAG TPA: sensor histidine kinase KdpD [Acetobacteraceae bacterium]|jgi:two-component system sensor histidine kinase KdpD|nr:sensor histidine kinase KdpD [Acetobacteraceae bacterium]